MKTVFKFSPSFYPSLSVGFLAGFFALGVSAAYAAPADVAPPPATPPVVQPSTSTAAAAPLPPVNVPKSQPVAEAPKPILPSAEAPKDLVLPFPEASDSKDEEKDSKDKEKGLKKAEDSVTDSVKKVIKQLGADENITINDLNSARQAVAKLDALLDIEKRLVDLEKVREERKSSKAASIPPIPASALTPPSPSLLPLGGPQGGAPAFPAFSAASLEVSRITGGGGRYKATIKTPDGQTKVLQAGDRLPDGTKVVSVSASGVELSEGGNVRTVRVKNVDTIFGNRR